MGNAAERISDQIAKITELNATLTRETTTLLNLARQFEAEDRDAAAALLDGAELVGRSEQARHGELIQLLAQADRVKAAKGGIAAWVATHLDATPGRAGSIAQAARRIGHLPELSEALSSGRVGAETVRALSRTARAIAHSTHDKPAVLATTLSIAHREGVSAANRHVRILEETLDPGRAEKLLARQRSRSFARIVEVESGMVRLEALLDQARATRVRSAIDRFTGNVLHTRQFDHTELVPQDVQSVEQIQAEAVTRFAEMYLTASHAERAAPFTATVLYHAPLNPAADAGLAEDAYGSMVPRTEIAAPDDPATHLIEHEDGEPVLLDGQPINTDPTARLATPAQRMALAFRDRTCTQKGCNRPATWALHAHHLLPHSRGGPTTVENLRLLCSEHHTLTHHPKATNRKKTKRK
jgi:hypothetical protein